MTVDFQLGRVVATPGAIERARESGLDPLLLIARHAIGDWGDLDPHDRRENERALKSGARLLSSYRAGSEKLWVITDGADDEGVRHCTTLLRPEDY